ncbi:MAG: TIM-barrel domain-containing protein [Planctomycetota bacterium]
MHEGQDEQQDVLGWLRTGHDSNPAFPADYRLAPGWLKFSRQNGLDHDAGPLADGACFGVSDGVRAFLPIGMTPDHRLPNPAFVRPPELQPEASQGKTIPRFGRCLDGRALSVVELEPGDSVYGTGMCAGPLERSGQRAVCWNADTPAYDQRNEALYQSHPWVVIVRADGTCVGVLADTTWRIEVDTHDRVAFRASGPVHPVWIIDGPSPAELFERLGALTGTMPMPPRWALGYQQSRWSYFPDSKVRQVAQGFRDRSIPCDVIWLDIDYMDRFRIFTFDAKRFPDPAKLNDDLHAQGFKTVWMIDPAPAAADKYWIHDQIVAGQHATLDSDNQPFIGSVWAGPSTFPDFTRPETRDWWAGLHTPFMARGIDGVWNDMNEPSVFDTPEKTMPERAWHRGGKLDEGCDLPPGPHAMYHNLYGLLNARASFEGISKANPEKRPFLLTRSGFIGSQRYAATWTGDNQATWHDLRASIAMTINLGLSGQPFCGPDIGGFIDHTGGDARLHARWMGIGCMLPFARAHVAAHSPDKEPWSLGPECEATSRRAIERRYRLLPYLYTLFREAHETGAPIARPVWWNNPSNPELRHEDRAFLLGVDLLVACDVGHGGDAGHFHPDHTMPGQWQQVELVEGESDPELPRVFARRGSIIALGPILQWSDERDVDPLELLICPDEEGRATGRVYEDRGDGHEHASGGFRDSALNFDSSSGTGVVTSTSTGDFAPPARTTRARVISGSGVFVAETEATHPLRIELSVDG